MNERRLSLKVTQELYEVVAASQFCRMVSMAINNAAPLQHVLFGWGAMSLKKKTGQLNRTPATLRNRTPPEVLRGFVNTIAQLAQLIYTNCNQSSLKKCNSVHRSVGWWFGALMGTVEWKGNKINEKLRDPRKAVFMVDCCPAVEGLMRKA